MWIRRIALLAGLASVLLTAGCTRREEAYYEDPAGKFRVLAFSPQDDGVDAAGTSRHHGQVTIALPNGAEESVTWTGEEFADGAQQDWRWTFVDAKTGVRRVYASSTTSRRASVSDGTETHTATAMRGHRIRVDNAMHATVDGASAAISQTPLCAATPDVFAYAAKALLARHRGPRVPSDCGSSNTHTMLIVDSCRKWA
jgi:hypothetical protein